MAPILARAYKQQSMRSLERVTVVRTALFMAILGWLYLNYGASVAADNALIIVLFIANGLAAYGLGKSRPEWVWVPYLIIAVDAVILGFTLLTPGRTYPEAWPWATVLRQPSFMYFLLLLALATLSLQPMLVLWAGVVSVAVWSFGAWLIARDPATILSIPEDSDLWLANYLNPDYVHVDDLYVRAFVTLAVSVILATAVWRARELVREQAEAARERANLARYVAPNLVERLASTDLPMGGARSLKAIVLFADVREFTARAEKLGPEGTMAFLRRFHGTMAEIVFEHGGTLDKFIGDGLMATFGTPDTGPKDASRAIECATAMIGAASQMQDSGGMAVEIGVGLHYGLCTTGDIGGGGRFEFAVIGDAVNVASRVERLTRDFKVPLLMTGPLIEKAVAEGSSPSLFEKIADSVDIRGRSSQEEIWSRVDFVDHGTINAPDRLGEPELWPKMGDGA
jgi:adenylate cyclase